jgi:hypothetical protein
MTASSDRERLAHVAADLGVQQQLLINHDNYLGALKTASEIWIVACVVVGVYVMFAFDEDPQASLAAVILPLPVCIIAAIPGMLLAATIARILRAPERRAVALITACNGNGRARRFDVTMADGATATVRPRFKAVIEATGGSMKAGSIGIAVLRGDVLVDWVSLRG